MRTVLAVVVVLVGCDSPGGGHGGARDVVSDTSAQECPDGQWLDGAECRCQNEDEQSMIEGECVCTNAALIAAGNDCIGRDSDDDADGLTNAEEIELGTSWSDDDTDGDGIDDGIDPTPTG